MRFHLEKLVQDEIDHYIDRCNFTDDEMDVFMLKVQGKSIVYISLELGMCEKKVSNVTKNIMRKIEKVRKNDYSK